MGSKISVNLFRAKQKLSQVGSNIKDPTSLQTSVWFATGRSYSKLLLQDMEIRAYLDKELKSAGLVEVILRRFVRRVEVIIYVTKPGIVIGKSGASINTLKETLIKKFDLPKDLKIEIEEFKDPMRSSRVVANEISRALEKGVAFRRVAKMTLEKIKYSGILGCKITIKGRLNGAEIARKEDFAFGSIPRHTIDSQIDYTHVACKTAAGIIGIRVMMYKGNKLTNFAN
jgi:small subunit ribosomal protein S3